MKRFAKLSSSANNVNKLTIYSGEDFTGDSKVYSENDKDMQKNGWKVPIKSLIVQGNPWVIYPELQYKVCIACWCYMY